MDKVSLARSKADWRRAEQLYRQFREIINDPEKENEPPVHLAGALAESLGRVLAHYDGKELEFVEDFLAISAEVENLGTDQIENFRRLYRDKNLERFDAYNPRGAGRRRPKPFEAVVETCRLLKDLNAVRDALSNLKTAGILGGSLSYGRFFNTCGAVTAEGSDTDLLLVIPEYKVLPEVVDSIGNVPGVAKFSIDRLRERLETFIELRASGCRYILSHKLRLWDPESDPIFRDYQVASHYLLSLHVFSEGDLDFMILKDVPILEAKEDGLFSRYVFDYRDTETARQDNQRSFAGIDFTEPLKSSSVKNGFVSKVAVCHIKGERFFPGLHQNLVLPQFEIRWDTLPRKLFLRLLGFKWKILERLEEERRIRPYEVQTLSLSHTRNTVFAPHITRRADRE